MNKEDIYFLNYLNELYEKYLIHTNISTRKFCGWRINPHIQIEALFLNLIEYKQKLDIGLISIDDFYNNYMSLFDSEFDKYLDWKRPKEKIELLYFLEEILKKETIKQNNIYYIIKYKDEIIGIIYLYDYKINYKTANLGIGLKCEYRGKHYCHQIIESLIKMYMGQGKENSLLIRLGYEVETTNENSILLVESEKLKKFFKKEGLLRNKYGENIDCFIYSYIL